MDWAESVMGSAFFVASLSKPRAILVATKAHLGYNEGYDKRTNLLFV